MTSSLSSYYEKVIATGEVKCIDDEIPFDVPSSWCWMRVKDIGITETGTTPSKSHPEYFGNLIPFYGPGNIQDNKIVSCTQGISKEGIPYCRQVAANTILQVCIGGSIGKAAITDKVSAFNQQINSLTVFEVLNVEYIFTVLITDLFRQQILDKATGTATPIINRGNWETLLVALPPIAEQQRIVNKLHELEPAIEQYGNSEEALGKLNASINDLLKKSILQEAIQGRLVPQVENEGTAAELLQQIKEEKQRLVKEGKLKKSALTDSVIYKGDDNRYYEHIGSENVCINDNIQLQIPATWTWCKIKDLLDIQTGAAFKKEQINTIKQGIRILRGGNILPNKYVFKGDDVFVASEFINDKTFLHKGDIITPAVTSLDNIGKMAVIDKDLDEVSAGGFVFIISPYHSDYIHSLLIAYFLQSPYMIEAMKGITKKSGAAFYNLGKERLKELYIPLPPLKEQQRIVAQIEKLFEQLR